MSEEKKVPEQGTAELSTQQREGVTGGRKEHFISAQLCTCCAKCVWICPKKCISRYGDSFVINKTSCNNCGKCVGVCPVGAIKILDL